MHVFWPWPQTYTHTWSLCLTGRQPASVAGRRRSTSSVWRTAWLCWRTRTKPSSRNSKPSKTCTATNPSRNVTKQHLPGARQVPVCPHVQRLSTEPCIWMPLPLFYSFAFFLKTAENSVKWLTRNRKHTPPPTSAIWHLKSAPHRFPIKGWGNVKSGCGGGYMYTGSLWWSDRTDNEAVLVLTPPKGSIPVTGAWTNWATSPATENCSITITTNDGTFYSLISPRHLDHLERLPLCATFVIVTALLH